MLHHQHSSIYSETTAGSNTHGELALRVNVHSKWAYANEIELKRKPIYYIPTTNLALSSLSLLLKLSHNSKWVPKETASYYVKKTNVLRK